MGIDRTVLEQIKSVFREGRKFFHATHVQPDGDAIGSLLGLSLVLESLGKEIYMSCGDANDVLPPQYRFLPSADKIVFPGQARSDFDCFIALDCAGIDRLGPLETLAKDSPCLINLDHHPHNSLFGTINLIDETYSSSSEILYRLLKELGVAFTPNVALCLYVGLVTDTGRFQYSNTSMRVFQVATELVELGVDPNYVFQNVYENVPFSALRLLGLVLSRSQLDAEKELVYSVLTDEDLKATGASLGETENFIDYLRAVRNARLAIIFKPTDQNGLKVSLRSKNELDVGKIARDFGGGGHVNAAGFTSPYGIDETIRRIISLMEK